MDLKQGTLPAIAFHDEAHEQWEQQINRMAEGFWLVKLTFQNDNSVDAYLRPVERDAGGMPMLAYVEDDGNGGRYPLPGSQPFIGAVVIRLDAAEVASIQVY